MTTSGIKRAIVGFGCLCLIPAWGFGQQSATTETSIWNIFAGDGFSYRAEGLVYGFARNPAKGSPLNPDNVLGVSSRQLTGNLRLDLGYRHDRIKLEVKPRLDVTRREWRFGVKEGEKETDTDAFVNEWLFRYRFSERISASYGRENLQWGPAFLTSPSNPFIEINGKSNPYLEVPGLDYAKIGWIPDSTWSGELIANTDEGRVDPVEPFRKTFAGKLDYVGVGRYGSMILSHREGGATRFGGYGGATISDALLGYVEGDIGSGSDGRALLGGSYTFRDGSAVTVEYYYNGDGCRASHIRNCFPPTGDTAPGTPLYKSNYGFIQYFSNDFFSPSLELALRGTLNLDDGSGLLTAIVNYELGDNVELFSVADWYTGGEDEEFGSILKSSVMGGVRLTY